MAKANPQELKDLGFIFDMFDLADDSAFDIYISAILADASVDLTALLGQSLYDTTAEPTKSYVRRAETYLAAAEMWKRRANIILKSPGNLERASLAASEENKQATTYAEMAEEFIEKLKPSAGVASSAATTSHFNEPT